jgi:uncharacterized secreted protein with C-terminal beta-propeller domain
MKKVRLLPLVLGILLMAALFTGCAGKAAVTDSSPSGSSSPSSSASADGLDARHVTLATSYEDIYKALNAALTQVANGGRDYGTATSGAAMEAGAPMPAPADGSAPALGGAKAEDSAISGGGDYSQTNVQVQGVDEGDIVKTDGQYIYVLRQNELIIFKVDGATTTRLGSIMVGDDNSGNKLYQDGVQTPEAQSYVSEYASDIYVSGDTVAVITSYNSWMPYYAASSSVKPDIMPPYNDNKQIAKVRIIDIADRSKPVLKAELGQDGYVLSSRLVDGTLYLISNYYVYNIQEGDSGTFVPRLYTGGDAKVMNPGCIAIMPGFNSTNYTVVCSYDLANAALRDSQSVLGGGSTVYMNKDALYIANSTVNQTAGTPYADSVYTVVDYTSTNVTDITRFDLTGGGLKLAASGTVPGSLYGQFALDEFSGSLRVVTTTYSQSWSEYTDKAKGFVNYVWKDPVSANALYVLNGELRTIGSIENLAPGEQVQSVRFDGAIGYVVTFRQVDPLFTVDLTDPTKPAVLSALKIPGFSQYLHVWSDGRLFGLGMDADAETGRTDGMKLTMFDTSNPLDVTVKNSLKLNTGWSNALYNHKAILISADKNIIAFPADSGYDIYGYTDEHGFRKLASISSLNWSGDSRGLYIGDFAYIVDASVISVLDMNTLMLLNQISY